MIRKSLVIDVDISFCKQGHNRNILELEWTVSLSKNPELIEAIYNWSQ